MIRAFHMKSEGKAPELLKRQGSCVGRQSRCMIKNISWDGGREYVKGSKKLKLRDNEVHANAL